MKYIINISDFNEIVNGIKAMKADLVMVDGNTLYGTDNNCVTLKMYHMNTNIPVEKFIIITKTLSGEFYNNITDVNVVIDLDTNKIYCPNNESYVKDKFEMIDNRNINRIIDMSSNLASTINRSDLIEFGEITNDEGFNYIRSLKSADGADLYYPKNNYKYGMYLYNGAIPMVKADKVYLKVFDCGNTFIANFILIKKKVNPVEVYFKFVKL